MKKIAVIVVIISLVLFLYFTWLPFLTSPAQIVHHEIGLYNKTHQCHGISLKETTVYRVFPAASIKFNSLGRKFVYSVPEVDRELLSEFENGGKQDKITHYYCLGTHLYYGE